MTNEPRIDDFFFPDKGGEDLYEILVCVRGAEGDDISLWEPYLPREGHQNKRWEGRMTKEGSHRPIALSGEPIEGVILPNKYTPMLSEHAVTSVTLQEFLKVEDRWNPLGHYMEKDKLNYPFGKE